MSLLVFNFEDKRFHFVLDYCVNILIVQSNIQVKKIEWNTISNIDQFIFTEPVHNAVES
jgi:hypothetical protein